MSRRARSPQEKLAALEEMLRVIPKHKGTEKLQADLRKRLSRLKKEEASRPSRTGHRPFYQMDREGAGRVVVCGPPNSGKSALVDCLTGARPEVADYPFTTRLPLPGMMDYEDIQIQLIDTPPLAPAAVEGWLLQMMSQGEVVLLVFDVNDPDLLEQTEFLLDLLSDRGILENEPPKLVVLAGKMDQAGADQNLQIWGELFAERFQAHPFSVRDPQMVEQLRERLFRLLDVVRVYTKRPGHPVAAGASPFLLKRGATVIDAAGCVHKDLASGFRFARIWRPPDRNGQMIDRHEAVQDRDLLEIHAS